jgi:hypothetical protein
VADMQAQLASLAAEMKVAVSLGRVLMFRSLTEFA